MSSHKGTAVDQASLTGPSAIFLGNEGAGLPREVMATMDESIAIPHTTQVESLNAGVAASIVLYEAARQRKKPLSSYLLATAPNTRPNTFFSSTHSTPF